MAWVNVLNALWRLLRRPWLLIVTAGLIGVVLLSTFFLPQMPGQVSSDATAATRWLLAVGAEYGIVGELLGSLGLFNVWHSMALQLLLAALALLLSVAIADSIACLLRYRRLAEVFVQPATEPGAPVALAAAQPIYRLRQAATALPDPLATTLQEQLNQRFDQVALQRLPVAAPSAAANGDEAAAVGDEIRLLAVRHLRWVAMRTVFFIGLLIAVAAMWLLVVAGWELSAVLLAPGDEFTATAQRVALHYVVAVDDLATAPQLRVRVANVEAQIPVGAAGRASVGGVSVRVAPAAPGLYVTTQDGQAHLARAGQTERADHLGLAFPSPGSEESIILPDAAVGLRIIRMGESAANIGDTAFMLEVYEGENRQPVRRVAIGNERLASVAINDAGLSLDFAQLPSLLVDVRYLPASWLFWVAVVLVVAGSSHFRLRSAFVVAQLNEWPVERSIVVVQGDQREEVEALRQVLPMAEVEETA